MKLQTSKQKDFVKYDEEKFKVLTWKKFDMFHYIINPGLVINELVLGQRIPKVMLVDKNSNKTLPEKTFIPCPHCHTLHPSLKWSSPNKTAFGNWFGYYCDNCGQIIPCLMNLTSYLILGITLPFWYFFKDSWKEKWLKNQREKFSQPMFLNPPEVKWWEVGLKFGASTFVIMAIISYLIFGRSVSLENFLIDVSLCTIAGIFFGVIMKFVIDDK